MSLQFVLPILRRNYSFVKQITRLQTRSLKTEQESEVKDEPVKYSTSKAGHWKAKYSTSGEEYFNTPKIQSTVVVYSLAAFLIYFCILREENDLDDWLRELEVKVPLQLEEGQLRAQIANGKKTGLDVRGYEERLKQVQQMTQKYESIKLKSSN